MRILVTGHHGYIGSVLAPLLEDARHQVVGLDAFLYRGCTFGSERRRSVAPCLRRDVRDVDATDLEGFDAVVHLAALSNDPLGNLDAETTLEINHRASVRLARAAREAGVERFVLASSCSLYGSAGGDEALDEEAPLEPLTPYGESKVLAEADLSVLADDDFSPTFLRNATVYGVSPRLRTDVVVNNLVGLAHTTGIIRLRSDGTSWRPLVHVEDVCRAFRAVLEAPRELVHDEVFNVGRTSENYRVREVADLVSEAFPDSSVVVAEDADRDGRSYRVDCSKIESAFPEHRPDWTVPEGIDQLRDAFDRHGLSQDDLENRYVRVRHVCRLVEREFLDDALRWKRSRSRERRSESETGVRREGVG